MRHVADYIITTNITSGLLQAVSRLTICTWKY